MGLPSGLKWAKNDIDVSQQSNFTPTPFLYNKTFFSWGNVNGHNPISESEFDYDCVIITSQSTDVSKVISKAKALGAEGKRVAVMEELQSGVTYRELIDMTKGEK